jgi:hypothetical protein
MPGELDEFERFQGQAATPAEEAGCDRNQTGSP